ncbi:MAG TPA: hypothetical protein VGD43_10565, partial [Micromonospora sp.]
MNTTTGDPARRRLIGLALLTCVAAGSGVGLAAGLVRPVPPGGDGSRALSSAEARRLAAVRVTNHREGRVGLRARVDTTAGRIDLAGWVDWRRPLVYLAVGGPGAGERRGLLQAVPGVLVTRSGTGPVVEPVGPPPATPPADGWRVRRATVALDGLVGLLFGLAAGQADPVEPLTAGGARWLRRDRIGGIGVDVLLGPAT